MEASGCQRSQLVPIRILTVFRVFVFHAPFPVVDLGGHSESAMDGMTFLTGLGGCAEITHIFRLRFH